MFTEASNFVEGVDFAFKFIFGIAMFFLVGLTTVMIVFIIKYNRKKHPNAVQIPSNNTLEITWTAIPLALVLLMFYYGYVAFMPMRNPPKDAMIVKTTGRMWAWDFEYANGKHSQELVVPLKKPVRLNMTSKDVVHSLYIPSFRVKEDVVPGRQTVLWFIAEEEGTYEIFCTAYCGLGHSGMGSVVKVVSQKAFDKWFAEIPKPAAGAAQGLEIIKRNACTSCHSVDGSKLIGPSFKGLYNSKHVVISNGKEHEITADSAYVRTSVLEPDKDVVKGFNKGLMRSYKGTVSETDIKNIIEYFKSISR
ncbi:MAG: cytochrome c oxidase subunit II [Bacteroidota bacterium]|nr:cytochrome c oxidase subunit II [Bacteroidota bacterium]